MHALVEGMVTQETKRTPSLTLSLNFKKARHSTRKRSYLNLRTVLFKSLIAIYYTFHILWTVLEDAAGMARHAKLSDDGGAGDHHFGGIPSSPVHNERHTYRTSSRRHGYFRHSMTFLGGFLLGIYGAFVFRNDLLTG